MTLGPAWALLLLATVPLLRRIRPARRLVAAVTLLGYATAVTAVTVFPIVPRPAGYWAGEPWWTVIHWIPFDVDTPSFVLNVILFLPGGVLVPLLWPVADGLRALGWRALAASATIESVQFALGLLVGSRRTVDVNDLMANTLGALAGLLVLRLAIPSAAARAWALRADRAD